MDCEFCNNVFKEYTLKSYNHWETQLFISDQYHIGRSVIILKNRHIVDITELTFSEREELFTTVIPNLKKSIDILFQPDLYNYSSLGNNCKHLHIHVIPRYKEKRIFEGKEFTDDCFGNDYVCKEEVIKLSEDMFNKLFTKIQTLLN